MTGPIDYDAVLTDLEARRAKLDAAIAGIRTLMGETAPPAGGLGGDADSALPAPVVPSSRNGAAIQSDTFFRLSTPDAIRKYLRMVKRPQTAKAIADALGTGGQIHAGDEKAAYINVATALRRNKDFVQTRNKEWGLAEFYSKEATKGEGE